MKGWRRIEELQHNYTIIADEIDDPLHPLFGSDLCTSLTHVPSKYFCQMLVVSTIGLAG